MTVIRSRIRIRRLLDVAPGRLPERLVSNYWALSRPHVAEEVERLEIRIREAHMHHGVGLGAREIHQHPVVGLDPRAGAECTNECLLVDSVTVETEKSEDELDREKVAG